MSYNIIAIEREYATGGREIGKQVAERLGIPCYGIEILEQVARDWNVSVESLQSMEERATGSFLYSLSMVAGAATGDMKGLAQTDELFLAEAQIIRQMAQNGKCVIIGRCAGTVLEGRTDVLNVFVHADNGSRVQRAVMEYHVDPANVEAVLRRVDKRRANYRNLHAPRTWSDKSTYHLTLNSGKLGIDACVNVLCAMMAPQAK